MENYIQLNNVSKVYVADSKEYTALKAVSIGIDQGEFVIIKGKSGSGKSTVLNLLAGIDKPTSGDVIIGSLPINHLSNNKLADFRGNQIGVVFQFFQLMPTLTVLENVLLPMELSRVIARKDQKARATGLLEKLDIKDLANKFPNALSGGEKQRVAIARALANNPEIIVADEPTGNLDSTNSKVIQDLFMDLNKDGKTIIYVTHEKEFAMENSRLIYLKDGEVGELHV
ncbi:MAG: ABC transporter ATP-binding protein [Vallitaleaceae bacterium]|jgi:ABC-type lipoprotein export system ATPase subunit|nr:ABC transporter ATP-binding protein [Vallitaleaceae bacterium]